MHPQLEGAATLASVLRLLQSGIKPSRHLTITKALELTGQYTGKTYRRSEINQAVNDLYSWIARRRANP
jgi:hypothetical protein